jgi:hypothetical protein
MPIFGQESLMKKDTKKKLTVEELDLEQLEGVTGGTSTQPQPQPLEPFKMNTGKPLPIAF